MSEIQRRAWNVLGRTAGNTVAPGVAVLCALAGIPVGESTALGAFAGSITEEGVTAAAHLLRSDRTRRVGRFAQTATEAAGCTLDELIAEASAYPEKLELLAQAVEGASRSLSDQKIDLLARMAAHGIRDDAKVDETLIRLDAVRPLEMPHLRVLLLLYRRRTFEGAARYYWRRDELIEFDPGFGTAINGVAAKLASLALADLQPDGREGWSIHLTRFGYECARFLSERETAE